MATKKHIVALPFPAEGHVSPMMHLCIFLAERGFSVTFAAMSIGPYDSFALINNKGEWPPWRFRSSIRVKQLATTEPFPVEAMAENRADMKLILKHSQTYTTPMEELLDEIDSQVGCVISDYLHDWSPKLAAKLGILGVVFIPASATVTWCELNIAKLAAAGLVPSSEAGGELAEDDSVVLASGEIRRSEIPWHLWNDEAYQDHIARFNAASVRLADWTIVNSCMELERDVATALSSELDNKLLPIGPLFLLNRDEAHTVGFGVCNFECLDWLDAQPRASVLYISFGSFAVLSAREVEEFARGLEASGVRFLWVIRPDTAMGVKFPSSEQGILVPWSPQTKVLAHPSVGAFLSHCGWNSTLEAAALGKPVLCWPLLFEQNSNAIALVRKWKTGARFARGGDGIVDRAEVERVIRLVIESDEGSRLRQRAENLGERIRANNAPSIGLDRFVDALRGERTLA